MDPKEKNIQMEHMNNMRSLFRHTPMIQMCRNTLHKHLLSNGLEVKTGKRSRDQSMKPFLEDWWIPFCADAIDSVICYGFIAYAIKKIDTGQKIPIVLLDGTYRIRFKIEDNAYEYRVFKHKDNKLMEDAYVYDDFGFLPRKNGIVTSLIESLAPAISNVAIITQSAVEMEALRRKPLMYLETSDTTKVTGDQEGIDYDFYADTDFADADQAAKFTRNEKQLEQLEQQQKLLNDFHRTNRITDFQHDALSSVVSLPEGARLTSVSQNAGRGDISSLTKSMEDNICGVFGIPRSMLMSDTPHKADTEGTHRQFQQTIAWWSSRLSACCESIYNIIHANEVKKKVMERASKRVKRNPGDLYNIRSQLQVRFSFPVTPLLGRQELKALYQDGLLDWERYYTMSMNALGLAYDKIPEEPSVRAEPQEQKVQNDTPEEKEDNEEKEEEDEET
jgi:hypothetical protein